MDAVRNIVFIVVLICVCDGTYFFKHKKHILPPIHHLPHAHPHPHPHPHFHHHHHPHGLEEHEHFHKFHGFKHVKTIIYPKILPLPKPVMYKTFLMRKYSLPPNFHVHIPLNKKMYGHEHGPFKPHTHHADKPMYLKKRKMKKIFKPKLPYSGGYGKYPVANGLSFGTRGNVPHMPGSVMQPQTNMFLPTGILPPSTFVPSQKPGINKYELWLRKINEWMLRNKNTAKGVPQKVNNRRVVNTIHSNVPFAVQKPIIQKPRTKKQNKGIIANFVIVKPPYVRKSEEPAGLGTPVSEKPKTLISNSILETPKLQNMELQPIAPVVGIPINLDNIGPPFDINVIGDQGQSALPPPIKIANDPAPGTVGGGDMIDVGLPIDLTPESFGPHPATPPNILMDGIPKEPTLNRIVPLPGNLNELLTDVADLSHFPKLDLSNEPLIIEPVGPVPPARLPLDIQPFPWDPSEIPFPPEVIPRSSNKEKEPYVMKPLEPIIKIIGRDRVKRKNETIFVPKPALNETEPSYIIKDSSAESDTIPTAVSQTQPTTTAQYRTASLPLPSLPVMEIREFEHLTVSSKSTTPTPQSTETTIPPSSDIPLPDPRILFNGTKGDGQHNLDMVDQIIEREQTNDTAFFKYKPHEYNISFPYLILHGPNSGQSPKGSQFETETTTTTTTTTKTIINKTPETIKTTSGVRLFTTTIPTPVINNQVNEEIVLDYMTDKYPQSSRADVVLDYSTPDRDTTTQTQQVTSPKSTSSTSVLTTTTDQVTSTTATLSTTQILTGLKPTTTTIKTTSTTAEATTTLPATTARIPTTPELAEMIVAATSTTQSPATQSTPITTTEDYHVDTVTPVYDYVTRYYEWLDNVTFVYEDIGNTTQQTTQTMAETTTTTLINETSEETPTTTPTTTQSSPILGSFEFSSRPTTSMMEYKSTKQTTTPDSETQTTQTTTTMTITTQQQETSPSTTISSTQTSSTPETKTTTSTEAPSTTEGPKICHQT